MDWIYYKPKFQMDTSALAIYVSKGPWSGHRRFAYDLTRFMKPKTIVELGTQYGGSFFSFCQAVKDGDLKSQCFAVDTWEGDRHSGKYGNQVYQAVSQYSNQEYKGISNLIRSKFDQALVNFKDDSISLLHIDGLHTYEAVLHDYTTWHRKIAPQGIVLFHDITEKRGDFGVYKLWEGLKMYPHLEFAHSHGLGVLFPKGTPEYFNSVIPRKDEMVKTYSQ
jgi:hypothetical protein